MPSMNQSPAMLNTSIIAIKPPSTLKTCSSNAVRRLLNLVSAVPAPPFDA
jgi:hypothetical protein